MTAGFFTDSRGAVWYRSPCGCEYGATTGILVAMCESHATLRDDALTADEIVVAAEAQSLAKFMAALMVERLGEKEAQK